jgi:putative ABC transport system substrate-binding protein
MDMPSKLFAAVLAIPLLVGVVVGEAQQAARPATIGVLSGTSREWQQVPLEAFRRELRGLGWEEGKNLSIEERFSDGDSARLPALSEELVQRKVEIIITSTSAATSAAMRATKTIPIVMVDVGDPLTSKFIAALARPGGNVTGTTNMALGLTQKRLEILKEALPGARRIAMMLHPESMIGATLWRDAEAAARHLNLRLQRLEIRNRDDLGRAFQIAVNAKADAVVPLADPLNAVLTRDILELAARHRLPTMMEERNSVEVGALLSYYANREHAYGRVASYVARILDGVKPGDLPVERPTTFELAINLKTAKALGLTIPRSLLQRADHVIE